jgi:hypothetical protein
MPNIPFQKITGNSFSKKSNLIASADVTTTQELLDLQKK